MSEPTDRGAFGEFADVSAGTLERFDRYAALLRKWNPAINLVAPSTLDTLWSRHFLDSAAVFAARPANDGHWLDLGSGAGFPGLVVALLAAEKAPALTVTCVEADQRKAAFLRNVSRETGLAVTIAAQRIEDLPPQNADVISARALAPLTRLLDHAAPHLTQGGVCLFPKGARHAQEVEEALAHWRFALETYPSPTDPESAILKIGDLHRA